MGTNLEKNSDAIEFRAKHHQPDRADPETARKAIADIRENLGDDADPMAIIWNDKLNVTQKRGIWIVAGLDGGKSAADAVGHFQKWRFCTDREKAGVRRVISTFAGLATRIKGAL